MKGTRLAGKPATAWWLRLPCRRSISECCGSSRVHEKGWVAKGSRQSRRRISEVRRDYFFRPFRALSFPIVDPGLCPGLHSGAASRLSPVAVTSLNAGYGRVTISLGLVGSTNFRPRSWLIFNVAGTSRSAICIFRVHDPLVQ